MHLPRTKLEIIGTIIISFSNVEHLACLLIAKRTKLDLQDVYEKLYTKDVSSKKIMDRLIACTSKNKTLHRLYGIAKEDRDLVAHGWPGGTRGAGYKDITIYNPQKQECLEDIYVRFQSNCNAVSQEIVLLLGEDFKSFDSFHAEG